MELSKILNIFEEHGFNENNCSFFRQEDITEIAKDVIANINYTRCSTQLKDLDNDNFEDWLIVNGYEYFKNFYLKGDKSFSESELMQKYNDEVMNL